MTQYLLDSNAVIDALKRIPETTALEYQAVVVTGNTKDLPMAEGTTLALPRPERRPRRR